MTSFEVLLANLDLKLFEKIVSQTTESDKRSLLACQLAARSLSPHFSYLEIGSHLGGSIQPYLLDDLCKEIYSIDKRGASQPDARGVAYAYRENSTQRMLENLKSVSSDQLNKINCIDGDTRQIDPKQVKTKTSLCFVDGEHTDESVISDFHFCMKTLCSNGSIVFHDANIIYNGLIEVLAALKDQGVVFRAYHLPDTIFVVEIGDYPLHQTPKIMEMLINNHVGYLATLQLNDHFRQFSNRFLFRMCRAIWHRLGWRR